MSSPPASAGGTERGAIVVGGGLAGLVTALRLAEGGIHVELFEAADRTGGKAGSDRQGDRDVRPYESDHGYHVFPAWYTATWRLIDELGIRSDFQRRRNFLRLRLARARAVPRDGWRLWLASHRLAFIFPRSLLAAVDLVSRDEDEIGTQSLDQFLRSRPYAGPGMGDELRDISLKGLGNPADRASALTFRANMRLLVPVLFTKPNWTAAKGPLQEVFIRPLQARAEAAGVALTCGRAVTGLELDPGADGFEVAALTFADGSRHDVDGRPVVLAVPHGAAHALLAPHGDRVPEALRGLGELESRAMAAFDVHLRRRLRGFPRKSHVILDGSRFHLTALDLRHVWTGDRLPGRHTVLQVIAADLGTEDPHDTDLLVADLRQFFPWLRQDDIAGVVAHPNDGAPLFMNTDGSEPFRPRSDERHGENLVVAGDWCLTPISLACMEGAVVSGTQAAARILGDAGRPVPALALPSTEASPRAKRLLALARPPLTWLGRLSDRRRR
jgi:phytoene dehydrogenase-like protein